MTSRSSQYYRNHAACPRCGYETRQTCIGIIDVGQPLFMDDTNRATCGRCKWVGVVHDCVAALPPTPGPSSRVLDQVEASLTMTIDLASIKLGRLREGSSAFKTQRGLVRGLQEALDLVRNERGGAAL